MTERELIDLVLLEGRGLVTRAVVERAEGLSAIVIAIGSEGRLYGDQLAQIERIVHQSGRLPRAMRIELTSCSPGEARSPKLTSTPKVLLAVAGLYPHDVLANPALDLLSLSDPAAWGAIVERAEAALSEREGQPRVTGGTAR